MVLLVSMWYCQYWIKDLLVVPIHWGWDRQVLRSGWRLHILKCHYEIFLIISVFIASTWMTKSVWEMWINSRPFCEQPRVTVCEEVLWSVLPSRDLGKVTTGYWVNKILSENLFLGFTIGGNVHLTDLNSGAETGGQRAPYILGIPWRYPCATK